MREFKRLGIILESDRKLPCVTALVAGERMKGSWWSHPKGRKIWHVLNRFLSRPDVLTTRLVSAKVTFIHRNLWPDLLAVGTSKESWQTDSLSPRVLRLLKLVERRGQMRTDDPKWKGAEAKSISDAARALELRLLVYSEEVHTARGFHAKLLQSWKQWSHKADFTVVLPHVTEAKSKFEELLRRLNKEYGADGTLPWPETQGIK